MDTFLKHDVIIVDKKDTISRQFKIINEEPLLIWVNKKLYKVIMRTPGDELAHAAGFCLYKELVNIPDDLISLSFKDDKHGNAVSIFLNKSRTEKISYLFKRHNITQDIYDVSENNIMTDKTSVDIEPAIDCLEKLSDKQPLRFNTHAAHAAVLYNSNFELLSLAEDVGRHNAVDKAVGKLFLNNTLNSAYAMVLSSRISYELVQKAAKAKIPVILAVSRPTSLAIKLATKLNMTLACLAKSSGLYIFCGEHRFKIQKGFISK